MSSSIALDKDQMALVKDYLTTQAQLTVQYGDRCVLLMQEGSFYDAYGYDVNYCLSEQAKIDHEGQVWTHSVGHAKELAVVLCVLLTHKDKEKPHSVSNPHKIGFPMIALDDKYLPVLLANDYTVVRMDQYKLPGSDHIHRKVTEVHSPVMEVDYIPPTTTSSQVVAIYLEYCKGKSIRIEKSAALAGIAVVDLLSGTTKVSEYYSTAEDREMPFQHLYRFLTAHQPREIIIHAVDVPTDITQSYESLVRKVLELHRYGRVTVLTNSLPKEYRTATYQEGVLQHTFQPNVGTAGLFQIINPKILSDLNLEEFQYARTALVILINYCHQFNNVVVSQLQPPETSWLNQNEHLVLAHNALLQLEVMSPSPTSRSKEVDSLFAVLNHCRTAVGKRRLSNLLQNPLTNVQQLNRSYTIIDELVRTKLHQTIDIRLQELPDLARLQRRLMLRTITPKEMAVLYHSYQKIIALYVEIMQSDTVCMKEELLTPADSQEFNKFFASYAPMVNFLTLETCTYDQTDGALDFPTGGVCPILPGHYPELDSQVAVLATSEQQLNYIISYLNSALQHEKGSAMVRISEPKQKPGATKRSEFSPTILVTTVARAQKLIQLPLDPQVVGQLMLREHSSSEGEITSQLIAHITSTIDSCRMWIRTYLGKLWQKLLSEFAQYSFYQPLVELVGKWDVYQCFAWLTVHYKYYRPTITQKDDGDYSYCDVKELRHPFIERIISSPYIPNDVSLSRNGWLLYGVNSTGKSSLARAVALVIIMAQAGCYVPGHLTYYPFRKIITRILGGDNTRTGQSSYAIELAELRTILRQADQYTLVVGDELAKGTETDSATGLTIVTMKWLSKAKSCYLFATHMHHITEHSEIVACIQAKTLAIKHLSVQYDPTQDLLIYQRKLQEGPGTAFYGLMVARAMGLPSDFLDEAYKIVEEIQKTALTTTKSRYNSSLYMQQCMDCGSKDQLHTHHIKPQESADAQGMIGNTSKDIRSNLMVLCENCHHRWHREGKTAVVQDTSQGIIIARHPSQ